MNLDVYRSDVSDFVMTGVPQVGTALGRIAAGYGAYRVPSGLSPSQSEALTAALEDTLGGLFPFLSNPTADEPLVALISLVNAGRVINLGAEVGIDHGFTPRLRLHANYSWLDHETKEDLDGLPPLVANGPEHKGAIGLSFVGDRLSAAMQVRWSERFRWIEGVVDGYVPSYELVNLQISFRASDAWRLGLDVSNALNNSHFEVFSGDLLGRRAVAYVERSW